MPFGSLEHHFMTEAYWEKTSSPFICRNPPVYIRQSDRNVTVAILNVSWKGGKSWLECQRVFQPTAIQSQIVSNTPNLYKKNKGSIYVTVWRSHQPRMTDSGEREDTKDAVSGPDGFQANQNDILREQLTNDFKSLWDLRKVRKNKTNS